jgi:hypothetical protein
MTPVKNNKNISLKGVVAKLDNIEKLKRLYEKGYKCIRYEDDEDGQFKMYFKNFEKEQIEDINSTNTSEINVLKSFVDKN